MTNIYNLFDAVLSILNDYVVPVIFAIAFIVFLIGIYRYFIAGGANEEKVQEGQKFVLWSVIGFVIMFSIWGIINLFINTLGFDTTSRPAFPTFPSFTGASGAPIFSNFGGSPSGSPYGGSPYGGGSAFPNGISAGQQFTDPQSGQQFTATGPNTYQPVNNGCGSQGTLNGTQCVVNSSLPSGGYGGGQSCSSNPECPSTEACNDATQTCQPDGPQTFSCSDDKAPDPNTGQCQDGSYPSNSLGQEAPVDGTVPLGGSCAGNENACADSGSTCDANGICSTSYNSYDNGGGSGSNGGMVDCGDGTYMPSADLCYNLNGSNTPSSSDGGSLYSCIDGNQVSDPSQCPADVLCPDGSLVSDPDLCPADTSGYNNQSDGCDPGLGGC